MLLVLVVCGAALIPAAFGIFGLISNGEAGRMPGYSGPWPRFGLTHTQITADIGDPNATRSAQQVLARQPLLQNEHIMGWGVGNPEPAPGVYDFGDLDRRINLIRQTKGIPIITLCCAPDWMKGGRPGQTDWNKIEQAPTPAHYQDFADLAAKVAARYPDVRYFIVWNELKGFFNDKAQRWDYEGYTRLYNLVYEAVKRVNPANQVGGPYPVMVSEPPGWKDHPSQLAGPWGVVDQRSLDVVDYWLAHKKGADFIVVDAATMTQDGRLTTDPFTALSKFTAVSAWIHQRTDLPLWFAEWYVEPPGAQWPEAKRVAVQAAAMMELIRSGVTTALYWSPQQLGPTCPGCLWTSTSTGDGGQATSMYEVLAGFARYFPVGTPLDDLKLSSGQVRVLAQPRQTVAVNTSDQPSTVTIGGRQVTLNPYEVRFFAPSNQ